MAIVSYKSSIKIGGTPIAFTNTHADLISGQTSKYQIRPATHRILDKNTPIVVRSGGNIVTATDYEVDYLFGIISFATAQTGIVRVEGSYIPVARIAGASSYTINMSRDVLQITDIDPSKSFHRKTEGMIDVSISMEKFFDTIANDFKSRVIAQEKVLLEFKPGNGSTIIRGWFVCESDESSGDVGSVESESLSFQISDEDKSFGIIN